MKIKLISLFLCTYIISIAQNNELELCILFQSETSAFTNYNDGDIALKNITAVSGLSKNYILYSCNNINNCLAVTYDGIRYILYDKDFMRKITSGNSWENLSILAHEVGHHVNGHTRDLLLLFSDIKPSPKSLKKQREEELEADEFSGFIMFKLGYSLEEAQSAISKFPNNINDLYSTHPSKEKRLIAIKTGYNNAKKNLMEYNQLIIDKNDKLAEKYFYKAHSAKNKKDYYSAITLYTKSIEN